MALHGGRLAKCLDSSFSLPCDVRFVFKEDVSVGGSYGGQEVKAHKLILAVASDVFERQFFGPMKDEKDIRIEDSTKDVFQAMIDFIYDKKISFADLDLKFLSSLYYLADKYDIQDLSREIIASLPSHEITNDNVLEVAILAEENCHHQLLSESLYELATAFLLKKFAGKVNNVFKFFSESEATEMNGLVLMKMLARMNFPPKRKSLLESEPSIAKKIFITKDGKIIGHQVAPRASIVEGGQQMQQKVKIVKSPDGRWLKI